MAALTPALGNDRDLLDYCDLDYSLVATSVFFQVFCIDYSNPQDFEFSVFCGPPQISLLNEEAFKSVKVFYYAQLSSRYNSDIDGVSEDT